MSKKLPMISPSSKFMQFQKIHRQNLSTTFALFLSFLFFQKYLKTLKYHIF